MPNNKSTLEAFKCSSMYDYEINQLRYKWSVRLFRLVSAALKVKLTLHDEHNLVSHGQILVINHFSRFETFIPQYLIHEETGAFCCSITHSEFFKGDDAFARYLLEVGGIPHDYDQILPLLAIQVLQGRKAIVFPEGGMVKNRHVVSSEDGYKIYSRTSKQWRKQHTGAAVLGICLDMFKQAAKYAFDHNDHKKLNQWLLQLKLDNLDHFHQIIHQPTLILPVNITFYPIRVNDNFLLKGARLLNPGIRHRHLEELLIESNIVLRETDMDIHVSDAVDVSSCWDLKEAQLKESVLPAIESIDQVFNLQKSQHTSSKQLATIIYANAECVRDQYAHSMYRAVTVNLSHLASVLIMKCIERKQQTINKKLFHITLYVALKQLQPLPSVFLHESLRNPETYGDLLTGITKGLQRFIKMAVDNQLITSLDRDYQLLPKLEQAFSVDEIRMENLIAVYANEVAAISELSIAIDDAEKSAVSVTSQQLARLRFNDEIVLLQWDIEHAPPPKYHNIDQTSGTNDSKIVKETATMNPAPFLIEPKNSSGQHGVLLIHGLLASPAETRPFGDYLVETGYTVLGVRLKGHGTTPLDLASLDWQEWYQSVKHSYEILADMVEHVHLVGFSTGGALALVLASEKPEKVINVAAICVPVKFQNPNMMLISLLHGVNRFTQWVATKDAIKAFVNSDTEHPDINYRHIPVSALYELRQLIDVLEKKIKDVQCPVALLQSQHDPVVEPSSALRLYEQLTTADATLIQIPADKHGILYENTGRIWERIVICLRNSEAQ
jgi:esterase/lipase/1-acyl-sn-glycerol-3-phosphate acyltransferase